MKKNIVIIHYNTPKLTEALIKSINKNVSNTIIYIFDNSDEHPFTAKFDNAIVLNNTTGAIIDFDEWLKKYPKRNTSPGKDNAWGSAKHCVSVQKCIDIINENFLLVDSDVLIKKDISDLFDDKFIYCAEVVNQPKSVIKRVLPYLCYINVKLCNEKKIKYFDEKKMHGLCCIPGGDKYDTGASFYLEASNLMHKDIKVNDYAEHYGHGSWDKKGYEYVMSKEEWLSHNKKYWSDGKNKKVIYTCITGGYDSIIEPKKITEDFDYICFTDDKTLTSNFWEIRELPEEVKDLSVTKKQRYVKINAHKVLPEYELSIWVDGNVLVKGDLNKLIEKYVEGKENISVFVPKHPKRNCIYEEAKICISMRKDTAENINPQIESFKKEGFPEKYGLLQSNILIRKHLNEDCIKLMEKWFSVLKDGSHRDQLSFNYACWRNQDVKVFYLPDTICYSDWFRWKAIHTKGKKIDIKERIKSKPNVNRTAHINNIKRYKEKMSIRYL